MTELLHSREQVFNINKFATTSLLSEDCRLPCVCKINVAVIICICRSHSESKEPHKGVNTCMHSES